VGGTLPLLRGWCFGWSAIGLAWRIPWALAIYPTRPGPARSASKRWMTSAAKPAPSPRTIPRWRIWNGAGTEAFQPARKKPTSAWLIGLLFATRLDQLRMHDRITGPRAFKSALMEAPRVPDLRRVAQIGKLDQRRLSEFASAACLRPSTCNAPGFSWISLGGLALPIAVCPSHQ